MSSYPCIWLKPGREKSIQRFHPWVFSGAVLRRDADISDGCVVSVLSHDNRVLATGFYNEASITVRVFSFTACEFDTSFYREKLTKAISLRTTTGFPDDAATNAFRLVHGEGDGMPGLIIDIYNSVAVIQCHHTGIYHQRQLLADCLVALLPERIRAVYSKSAQVLKLPAEEDGFLIGETTSETEITENGMRFLVNVQKGQKTGFFLDQRDNRKLLSRYAQGKKVLNTFCYSGGFSVFAAAGNAAEVCSVDSSAHAIELARANTALNKNTTQHTFACADAVPYLQETRDMYDVIVLDPPAFAKHLSAQKQALKGYRRINEQALLNIRKGGILFTFSCSQAVSREMFESVVMAAAIAAGRDVKILHRLTQPADHPVSVFHPEGEYLKGLVLYVD